KNDNFADLLLEASPGVAVGESSFVQGRLGLSRHQRLNSAWTLAGRVFLGLSGGDLPSNRRFDLGNANMLRGFAAGDVLSKDVLLGSAEIRGDVLRNFDFAFPWGLAFLSRLQLVTFVDAALLSEDPDVFGSGDSAVDVGIGVRLHGRWFGIIPSMGTIDVGYPVDGDENGGVRIYLGLSQAF
ncbi:MAG TPA: BamA/TamA family outer membrane protein, partial [Candidatus Eisenbacteria bacterium]|nr:BamA/TamA family outer membrane protein [Candidatus Eisenbacteria bacterium]